MSETARKRRAQLERELSVLDEALHELVIARAREDWSAVAVHAASLVAPARWVASAALHLHSAMEEETTT